MSTGLDLAFDDAQQAIGDTLRQFCADRLSDGAVKSLAGELQGIVQAWCAMKA